MRCGLSDRNARKHDMIGAIRQCQTGIWRINRIHARDQRVFTGQRIDWNKQRVAIYDTRGDAPTGRRQAVACWLRIVLRDQSSVRRQKLDKDFVTGIRNCICAPFEMNQQWFTRKKPFGLCRPIRLLQPN